MPSTCPPIFNEILWIVFKLELFHVFPAPAPYVATSEKDEKPQSSKIHSGWTVGWNGPKFCIQTLLVVYFLGKKFEIFLRMVRAKIGTLGADWPKFRQLWARSSLQWRLSSFDTCQSSTAHLAVIFTSKHSGIDRFIDICAFTWRNSRWRISALEVVNFVNSRDN